MSDRIECMEHSIECTLDEVIVVKPFSREQPLLQTPIDCLQSLTNTIITTTNTTPNTTAPHPRQHLHDGYDNNQTIKSNGLAPQLLIPFSSVIFILFIVLFIPAIDCKPTTSDGSMRSLSSSASDQSYTMEYLVKYGYLPKSNAQSVNLLGEKRLQEAIRAMQAFAGLPATGVVDNATAVMMRSRKCNVPDVLDSSHYRHRHNRRFKRYSLQGSKWNRTALTWSVKDLSKDLDYYYVIEQLKKAFKVWSDASQLTFTENRRPDADIMISFLSGQHGDQYPFDGPGAILGHAFFPADNIGGDAHFDADEQWDQRQTNEVNQPGNWRGVSLYSVAAHEFGHSLGLAHSSVSGSLMFPYYQTISEDFRLPYDDTVAIQQLYGARDPSGPGPSYPSLPTPNYPQTNRPTHTKLSTIPKFSSEFPNPCNMSIDAIASIRREIFVFKSKYFWWLKPDRSIDRAEPTEIIHYWPQLPKSLTKVDAVFERPKEHKIVFFIDKRIYVFNSQNRLEGGYPQPLTSIGLPAHLDRVDAAMVWGHNEHVYLFSGSQYWMYDEVKNRVDMDYPRDTASVWKGFPVPFDSAFQWSIDKNTYFFKDRHFWRFDDRKMQTSDGYPLSIGPFWFRSLLCRDTYPFEITSAASINLNAWYWIQTCLTLLLLAFNSLLFYNTYVFCIYF